MRYMYHTDSTASGLKGSVNLRFEEMDSGRGLPEYVMGGGDVSEAAWEAVVFDLVLDVLLVGQGLLPVGRHVFRDGVLGYAVGVDRHV